MQTKLRTYLAIASLATLCLSGLLGCAQAPKSTYSSVYELKLAYEEAGGDCSEWVQDNAVLDADDSGNCDGDSVLMVFDSKTSAEYRANALAEMLSGYGFDVNLLLGENWLINSPDVELIKPALGGKLVTG